MIGAALRGKNMDSGECGCGGKADSCCGGSEEKQLVEIMRFK
jgi:hypothetical protein